MKRTLPKLFRYVRRQKRLNQAQFAKALGVTQSTISRVENGLMEPGYVLIRRFYAFAGKNMEELLNEMNGNP